MIYDDDGIMVSPPRMYTLSSLSDLLGKLEKRSEIDRARERDKKK